MDTIASSADQAHSQVEAMIPTFQSAISMISAGNLCRFEFVAAQNSNSSRSAFRGLRTAFYEPVDVAEGEVAELVKIATKIQSDPTAATAAASLHRAVKLDDLGDDESTQEASLLAYFKVIEVVASKIPFVEPPNFEEQRRLILTNLEQKLASPKLHAEVLAVRNSTEALDRLDGRFIGLRVGRAGRVLALGDGWIQAAEELATSRNKYLGHSNPTAAKGVAEWFTTEKHPLSPNLLAQ